MIANRNGCRYSCGLDHDVLLEGYPLQGSKSLGQAVPRLLSTIAELVALRPGPLKGKEIRFLRRHIGLTPEELDDRIDFGAGLIDLAETGNWSMTRESDVELRRLVFLHIGSRVPSFAALYALYASQRCNLAIRLRHEESTQRWALAA